MCLCDSWGLRVAGVCGLDGVDGAPFYAAERAADEAKQTYYQLERLQ